MNFPITLSRFEALPLSRDPARILIRWEVAPTRVNLKDFEFYIDRGDAPDQLKTSQLTTIDRQSLPEVKTESVNIFQISQAINGNDYHHFVDYTPELRNLSRQLYYRIRTRQISTGEEVVTRTFSWSGVLDLVGLYIVDENNWLLADTTGSPTLVYPRRRGGIPCPDCFDPIQKKRTSSSCTTCYSTNWVGGFYQPIDVYIDFRPNPKSTVIQEWGETEENQTDVQLTNYPVLNAGDLVRELVGNRLWRVDKIRQTEKGRVAMLQFARLVELKPGDIEHRLPVDEEFIVKKLAEFESRRHRREF